ncbi:MAG: DUF5667 domain-containing protein [Chloroflexi bacterium]|nr:DUF5667 domain-containing protein [Chloroflexota bacterium]
MNKLYDVLEICLQELEHGVSLENILARYPKLADELRPILKASITSRMRSVAISSPSPEAIRRGRAKLLQRASEMREAKATPRRRVISMFQRLALSLGLTATFLLSGTGLVGASANALPGENLYPVKRTWEDVRLLFIFDDSARNALKSQFGNERLQEVNELITEGRHELIQFAGIFMQVNGTNYVSGLAVQVPANLQIPENGTAIIITGRTNAQGFVELESIELLPDGVFVPTGHSVEVESESNSNSASNTNEGSENSSSSESENRSSGNTNQLESVAKPEHRDNFEVEGIVASMTETTLVINGSTVYLDNATIEGDLKTGAKVEIKGYYESGKFIVTEVKVLSSESGGNKENSGSSDNSSDSHNSNDNGSGGSDSSGGDDSGGGGHDSGGDGSGGHGGNTNG